MTRQAVQSKRDDDAHWLEVYDRLKRLRAHQGKETSGAMFLLLRQHKRMQAESCQHQSEQEAMQEKEQARWLQ